MSEKVLTEMKTDDTELRSEPNLFTPIKLRSVEMRNRIAVSPMCQYMSEDGFATDWHLVHLGSRAVGGAALVVLEASAVEARGRITPDDLGIYKDEHVVRLKQITEFISSFGAVPGIQIAHAGRKASTKNPWKIGNRHEKQDLLDADGGWPIVGASPIPFSANSRVPEELSISEIKEITEKFADAARRALSAGFKFLEIHSAHGYLLHSFYSPLSNQRKDEYGGSFDNRVRFLLNVVEKVRAAWPQELPLAVRISGSDWVEGGWSIDDSVMLSTMLKDRGVDIVDCSSAFVRHGDKYPVGPGWQLPISQRVREEAQVPTIAVGMITEAEQANEIVRSGKADMVMLAREMMRDPYWPYHASKKLGIEAETLPRNYSYAI